MYTPKPTSRFIFLTLTLLLFLSLSLSVTSFVGDEDLEGIEELMALDEQVELKQESEDGKPSEAEVLSKAQRIVIELDNDNTERVIDANEFVLVLGYAPWCARSAELMPQFAEAATALKELGSPLLFSKLDAERHSKAASTIGIKGFPTLLLFVNGTSQSYTGGFTSEEIVIWARKKTGEPVIRIGSVEGAKEFLKKYSMFVVGLFEKFEGFEYEEFVKTATSDNEIQFVATCSIDVANVLFPDMKPHNFFLGLVKSEPERYTAFEGTFKMEKILQFLDYNKFPLVTTVTELNSVRVYSSPIKLQVYVFAEADDFKSLLEPLQNIARKFKSEIMFLHVDIREDNLAKPFLTLFGLEESEDAVVAAFDNKISSKYLLESDPTPSKMEEFCSGLLHGTLAPYYKSQPIPDNKEDSIQTIVGKTFDDLVLSSPKNILLEVHTPWCITCETTSKQVEKLAKHFKGLDNLIFARIDASANEHPKLQIDDYPTLLFYPAGDKSNPIKLPTKSSLKELATLVNKNLKNQDHITKEEL
ncbi:protein disulfide isomerase-like 1-6 [Camellia sinensis]|uniref:protein disulfide isomerase-like 1-6 n=1 Tax=Camellia sinensis TaxID=4442 RepID=UPI001035F96A|nr:protein disulfide isomerase-like 1-6 [Camellia sinensis]